MEDIQRIRTITDFHRTRQLPAPEHPLISIVDYSKVQMLPQYVGCRWVFDFYFISLKKNIEGKIRYGHQSYDFDGGVMFFIAPGQVFGIERNPIPATQKSGWMLLVHPDFIWNTPLATDIRKHEFFSYAINEALFVSGREEDTMMSIIRHIEHEYHASIDAFSQGIICSQIETLLNYSERFYHRQFLTRKRSGHQVLDKLEALLDGIFTEGKPWADGLPTVQYFAGRLAISPKYLSNMLKALTGQTVQQLIHDRLIERAKEKLATTKLTVSEIAYELGFGHPQSFSKLFKNKTSLSPLEFRRALSLS